MVYHVRHGPFTERIKTRLHLSHHCRNSQTLRKRYVLISTVFTLFSYNFVILLGFVLLKHIKILFLFYLTTRFQSTSKFAVLGYTNNSDKTNGTPLQMKLAAFKFLLAISITMAGMVHATPVDLGGCGGCALSETLCANDGTDFTFSNGCYRCCW